MTRRPPPLPEADHGGGPCGWCERWGAVVVELDGELSWACLSHREVALGRGWRQAWPADDG